MNEFLRNFPKLHILWMVRCPHLSLCQLMKWGLEWDIAPESVQTDSSHSFIHYAASIDDHWSLLIFGAVSKLIPIALRFSATTLADMIEFWWMPRLYYHLTVSALLGNGEGSAVRRRGQWKGGLSARRVGGGFTKVINLELLVSVNVWPLMTLIVDNADATTEVRADKCLSCCRTNAQTHHQVSKLIWDTCRTVFAIALQF